MSHHFIGKPAPQFQAKAVAKGKIIDDFSLKNCKGKYTILFFYPLDFTFVCPTELHAFQDHLEDFHQRDTEVIGCSVDSVFSHLAWLETPKNRGGIEGVEYPLLSDLNKQIATDYGVLKADEGIAYRGLFLIDKEGIIRHFMINDLGLGRSINEVIRTLDALIFTEKHGQVCPANWSPGKEGMVPTAAGLSQYLNDAS